jgi:hypothetical protein
VGALERIQDPIANELVAMLGKNGWSAGYHLAVGGGVIAFATKQGHDIRYGRPTTLEAVNAVAKEAGRRMFEAHKLEMQLRLPLSA